MKLKTVFALISLVTAAGFTAQAYAAPYPYAPGHGAMPNERRERSPSFSLRSVPEMRRP